MINRDIISEAASEDEESQSVKVKDDDDEDDDDEDAGEGDQQMEQSVANSIDQRLQEELNRAAANQDPPVAQEKEEEKYQGYTTPQGTAQLQPMYQNPGFVKAPSFVIPKTMDVVGGY